MSEAEVLFRVEEETVPFGRSFVASEAFRALFRDGMALVEQTAAYLDGDGREDSSRLGRQAALTYASESMRLTTRLMQIASWLLVQRAVAEGEISQGQALKEKNRVRLQASEPAADSDYGALPEPLRELIATSLRFHARILHLDMLITEDRPKPPRQASPVAIQHRMLQSAFAGG